MDKFVIVNINQLEEGLKGIANKIKEKLNETEVEYNFPDEFITAIDKLMSIDNVKTEADIIVNDDNTITIPAGYYAEDVNYTF